MQPRPRATLEMIESEFFLELLMCLLANPAGSQLRGYGAEHGRAVIKKPRHRSDSAASVMAIAALIGQPLQRVQCWLATPSNLDRSKNLVLICAGALENPIMASISKARPKSEADAGSGTGASV